MFISYVRPAIRVACCRTVATHPNIARTSVHTDPVDVYSSLVRKGTLREDESQLKAAHALRRVLQYIYELQEKQDAVAPLQIPGRTAQDDTHNGNPASEEHSDPGLQSRLLNGILSVWQTVAGGKQGSASATVATVPNTELIVPVGTGLYIHGNVGCGKTMLMDIFYHCVPVQKKRRVHLTQFLSEVQQRLFRLSQARIEERNRKHPPHPRFLYRRIPAEAEYEAPKEHLVDVLSRQIAEESWVICFDEFQVTDIADATLLTRLFHSLFQRGVVVVATSNKPPDKLYGDNRIFSEFLSVLKQNCLVFELVRNQDYRISVTNVRAMHTFLTPDTDENRIRATDTFHRLCRSTVRRDLVLLHLGRKIQIPLSAGGAALFDFTDICGNAAPLHPSDYRFLAHRYHTVFLLGVPQLGVSNRDAARRFICLVDELYQYRVKLVCVAAAPISSLFHYSAMQSAGRK
eukprot:TRINITY_DN16437_c0_g1_i2.p1 TRINITY_DN16437_c0_g1~~TRINITY_DN16437_c0_g1_i2.p1  ORF type:complete len:460 (-),score=60.13 TRINITY_DN16437_c0_g1_i2:279-1658(-)